MNTQFILWVGEEGRGVGQATAMGGLKWNEGGQTIGDNGIKKQMYRGRKVVADESGENLCYLLQPMKDLQVDPYR